MMRPYEVKLATETHVYTRIIMDSNSIRALRVGLGKMPDDITGPLRIICTPLCSLEVQQVETEKTACAM